MANVHELRDILLEAMAMIECITTTSADPDKVSELNRRAYSILAHQNEPAPAQDEREAFEAWLPRPWSSDTRFDEGGELVYAEDWVQGAWIGWRAARATRPAQTEQQPVAWRWMYNGESDGPYAFNYPLPDDDVVRRGLMAARPRTVQPLYAAPIAQTALQPEQSGLVEALRELLYARTDKSEALAIAALAAHRAGGGEHE